MVVCGRLVCKGKDEVRVTFYKEKSTLRLSTIYECFRTVKVNGLVDR